MEHITAYAEFFKELRICDLGNIRVAIILLITGSVVIHGLLQRSSNAYIVNYKSTFLVTEYTVYTGDSLHQIIATHRLVHIHCCQRRNIEAGQPHINNNGNLHRTVVILEFLCQFIFMTLVTDNIVPFLRVIVAAGHYNTHFFRPGRTKLQNTLINLHGNRARISHDHCLTGK